MFIYDQRLRNVIYLLFDFSMDADRGMSCTIVFISLLTLSGEGSQPLLTLRLPQTVSDVNPMLKSESSLIWRCRIPLNITSVDSPDKQLYFVVCCKICLYMVDQLQFSAKVRNLSATFVCDNVF